MIDERTRQMIEAYIPSPPDPTLDFMEYYYLQSTNGGDRVIRVRVFDIWPHEDDMEYNIFQKKGMDWVRIDSGWGDPFRGVQKHDLYDSKQDCKDRTHYFYDGWEHLRQIQQEEAKLHENLRS